MDPSCAEIYVQRGLARRLNGSLNDAIQDFERAEKIDPQSTLNNRQIADSYSNRGYIEMKNLELGNAIDDFTKAIKAYEDAIHYFRRGQARLIDEDLQTAIEDFNRALTFNLPNDFLLSMIYANRGYALLLKGRKSEARSDFQKVIEPNNGQRVIIELHLRTLETQIKEMRRKRIQALRNVS